MKIGSLLWERIVGVMLTTKKRLPSKYLLVGNREVSQGLVDLRFGFRKLGFVEV